MSKKNSDSNSEDLTLQIIKNIRESIKQGKKEDKNSKTKTDANDAKKVVKKVASEKSTLKKSAKSTKEAATDVEKESVKKSKPSVKKQAKKVIGETKSIIISICGEPNSGKSSIVNLLCGTKVSIVSHKPQASRNNIRGIANYDNTQVIFIDTPGVFKPKLGGMIERQIARNAWNGIRSGEKIILIVDPTKKSKEGFNFIIDEIKRSNEKAILIINKMDLLKKEELDEFEESLGDRKDLFEQIFRVSTKLNVGFVPFVEFLQQSAKASPWLYQNGETTDQTMEQIMSEITREVLFKNLEQELPYNSIVETNTIAKDGDTLNVYQTITVTRDGHKKIIIGKQGTMLMILLKQASGLIKEHFNEQNIKLRLFVKVGKIQEKDI